MIRKNKILVVDDSGTIRKIIRDELDGNGYEITTVDDGNKALDHIANNPPPDLITLDIDMPGLNGFETCKKLREGEYAGYFTNYSDQRVPIIFITANDNLADRKKGFKLGATDFLTKPFAKGEVFAAVNKILRPDTHLNNLSALVVDDSQLARSIVTSTLEREGVNVNEAEDGNEAFEIIQNKLEEIDILITDLVMPQMKGDELCKKVRKELNLQDLPIIFLTATSEQSELLDLFRAGGTDYIVKPFVKEELLARITVHLERAMLTKRLRETVGSLRTANEEIRILSITDPLTKCYNRGYMSEQLAKEIDRAKRYNHHLSILLCDIDHFKAVNDTYGHHAGDEVLKHFVQCIIEQIRNNIDWVSRYGGEEFIIVLPETDLKGAGILAERIRIAVSERKMKINGKDIHITSSIGVTGIDLHTSDENLSIENFIKRSDTLLYQAKEEGRNMVKVGGL